MLRGTDNIPQTILKCSPHSVWMWEYPGIMLVPQNTVMNPNNVMNMVISEFEFKKTCVHFCKSD